MAHRTFAEVKQEAFNQVDSWFAQADPKIVLSEDTKTAIEIGIHAGMGAAFSVEFDKDLNFKKGL
jgi:hypothetical protein